MTSLPRLSQQDYTIGWICALPLELTAGRAVLDEEHGQLLQPQDHNDHNTYTLGRIGKHNVVMACLPIGKIGTTPAAKVATHMQSTFRQLKYGLMVGIGGGLPSEQHDIRLGDVVVSQPQDTHGGVVQYDLGKKTQGGRFLRTGALNKPPHALLTALSALKAKHPLGDSDFMSHLANVLEKHPRIAQEFSGQPDAPDILYEALYDHPNGAPTCSDCDVNKQVERPRCEGRNPTAHYGLIASANQVMRDGTSREKLREETGAICCEMEAAGLMDDFPCLVIRGICDYADSHKNKAWQPHAAMTAACFAKELLKTLPERWVGEGASVQDAVIYPASEATNRPHAFALDRIENDANTSIVENEFQQHLKEFKSKLTPKQSATFKTVTLKNLRTTLLRIDQVQAERFMSMNLPRVETFVARLHQLSGLSTLDTSEGCTYIWASIKFALQTTYKSSEAFGALLGIYDQIASLIAFDEKDLAWSSKCLHKDQALTRIHENINEFHILVLPLLSLPVWQSVFSSVWRATKLRRTHLLEDLHRIQELVKTRASAPEFHEYNMKRHLARAVLEQAESEEKKAWSTAIIPWLAGADTRLDHDDFCKVQHSLPGSGEWLLSNPKFIHWKHDGIAKDPGLWLSGIPGAGKTILASAVIEDCEKDANAQVAYFYCKHGDSQRTTFIPILRSILRQLIKPGHLLLPWCHDLYLDSNQLSLFSEKSCREMLRTILLNTDRAILILDGIDECEPPDRKLLLSFVSQLLSDCGNQEPGKLRVFITSRDEPDICRHLHDYTKIEITPDDNEKDIKNYILQWRPKLQEEFTDLSGADLDYIRDSTLNRADGMFLFAKLVMTNLHQQLSLENLQREISSDIFPNGLEQAYARILDRIRNDENAEKVAIAQKILAWMTCARRPLKWHEIQGAISIRLDSSSVDFTGRSLAPTKHIREICGSLVSDLPGGRVELVHRTAKEFLLHSSFVRSHDTECYLASLCLGYLTFECFDRDVDEAKQTDFLRRGFFGFQDYALTHWSDHVNAVIKAGPIPASDSWDGAPDLETAITNFVAHHQLPQSDHNASAASDKGCSLFSECSYFDDICAIHDHIQRQKERGIGGLDEICPKSLKNAVMSSRENLESYARSANVTTELLLSLIEKYGPKWFKCPKVTCYYFHEGFGDLKSKNYHVERHEQPYRCGYMDCERGYKLGFSTHKDLERHMLGTHPENARIGVTFTKLKRRREDSDDSGSQSPKRTKAPAKFACELCTKSFTRQSILNTHMLTHSNTKPFKCSECDKSFVRASDQKRHEKIHLEVKRYACHGELKYGRSGSNTWGCGRTFPRHDALKSHLRSDAGQSCLKPLYEEEELDKHLALQIKRRRAEGWELPLPQRVLDVYPELRDGASDSLETSGSESRLLISQP